jgi:signal transduction histidine kinase
MTIENEAYGILIGTVLISLIVLFCLLLIKLYIQKNKAYTQQLFQKDLDFQKTLTTTVIETQEQVLQNISQDLHDDAGQQLTVMNLQLEHLKYNSTQQQQALEPLSESVRKLSESIRSISHALNNQLILQQDLLKAISTEIERLQKNSKTAISLSLPEATKREFSSNEKIIIYRIFQEGMNNALKHAKATEIKIAITLKPQFEMIMEDNGKGFNQDNAEIKKSLGLSNMKTRAQSIDYNLELTSNLGQGTTITLTESTNT